MYDIVSLDILLHSCGILMVHTDREDSNLKKKLTTAMFWFPLNLTSNMLATKLFQVMLQFITTCHILSV